jgi:predicted small lipoprotein YifL
MRLQSLRRSVLSAIAGILVAGCGQKGPLTLPEDPDGSVLTPAGDGSSADETAGDETDDDDQ